MDNDLRWATMRYDSPRYHIYESHHDCHVSCQETSGDGDWTLASTYVLRLRRASCPELAEESQTTAE